jgi:hypothetical protein
MVVICQFVLSKTMRTGVFAGRSPLAKAVPIHFWTGAAEPPFTARVSAPLLVVVVLYAMTSP